MLAALATSGDRITERANGENLVDNKQTWEHVEEKKHDIQIMVQCCEAELRTMEAARLVPAPYYFERVAILSRKARNYQQEIDCCNQYVAAVEKFYSENKTVGMADVRKGPRYKAILKRLPRARELLAKQKVAV